MYGQRCQPIFSQSVIGGLIMCELSKQCGRFIVYGKYSENNWGGPECALHLSNGVPCDLYIYLCMSRMSFRK